MGVVPAQLLPARAGALAPVPRLFADAGRSTCRRSAEVLRRSRALADRAAFAAFLAPLQQAEWVVYAKEPFGGPQAVLAYLSRYTHRVAISNRRLVSADETCVTFNCKDYRIEGPAATRR